MQTETTVHSWLHAGQHRAVHWNLCSDAHHHKDTERKNRHTIKV